MIYEDKLDSLKALYNLLLSYFEIHKLVSYRVYERHRMTSDTHITQFSRLQEKIQVVLKEPDTLVTCCHM